MLTLPIRTRAGLIEIGDDLDPDIVYVALARPRVARRADGSPRLRLVRWTAASGAAEARITGARLSLDVEVEPGAADLAAAGVAARRPRPLPWLDAVVLLEGPQFDSVEAEASVVAGHAAAVSVELSPLAAGVLAPLLQGETVSPLQVTWVGHVLVRLPAVEVVATADVSEIRRRIEIAGGGRRVTTTRSIIDANARIEIRGAGNAALEEALRAWVLDELARRLAEGDSLSIRAAASDVVRWPIRLATTLDDLVPPSSGGTLVETIVLGSDALGATPPIDVRVLGDFSGPLERVDVRLQANPDGDAVTRSMTSDAPEPVALGARDFRWSRRVKFDGQPPGAWTPWTEAHGVTALVVPIALPSQLHIEVLAAGLDFETRWASVRVVLEHAVPGAPLVSHTVDLDLAHPSRTWIVPLTGPRGVVTARATYMSRQGQSLERVVDEVANDQVIVTDPLDHNRVCLALVPTGTGWADVACVMVDLRYADGAHVVDETVELRTLQDFVEWEAPARPDGPRTIEWRRHASFSDGGFDSSGWSTAAPGVQIVRLDGVPRRTVQVLPIYFDPATTSKATVRLLSGPYTETLTITGRSPQTATLDAGPFTWTVKWVVPDGTEHPESAPQQGEDVIVLPRFQSTSG